MAPGKSLALAVLIAGGSVRAAEVIRARVLLDDVIPPASPVSVKLYRGDRVLAEAVADQDGRFSLSLKDDIADRAECRLAAAAEGYEPASVALGRLPRNPEIGAVVLQRAGRWNGYALSVTSLAVTSEAREHFAAAVHALREGGQQGMVRAEREFAEASRADAGFAEAWYQLGRMRLARQEAEGAREALRQAIHADPWYTSPYRPLLLLELADERWESAVEVCTRLLALNPYLADIRYHRAVANLHLDRVDAAVREAEAIATGPEGDSFPLRHHLEGLIQERQGKHAEAREAYRRYLFVSPGGPAASEVRRRLAAIEEKR